MKKILIRTLSAVVGLNIAPWVMAQPSPSAQQFQAGSTQVSSVPPSKEIQNLRELAGHLENQVESLTRQLDYLKSEILRISTPTVQTSPPQKGAQPQKPYAGTTATPTPETLPLYREPFPNNNSVAETSSTRAASLPPREQKETSSAETSLGQHPNNVPLSHLPDGSMQERYSHAKWLLSQNNFVDAETALRDMVALEDMSPLIINARYWLGEIYYLKEDYKTAAIEFAQAYETYAAQKKYIGKKADNPQRAAKVPEILIKMAYCLVRLEKKEDARATLKQLNNDFPFIPDNLKTLLGKVKSAL